VPADGRVAAAPTAEPIRIVADDAALRRELTGWLALAIGALGIAGLFALLLAMSRVPGIEGLFPWPLGFFHKGLVIHVVFSFVVWFLAMFGALALLASDRLAPRRLPLPGLGLAVVAGSLLALPLLFVPALLDRGQPTLNNYVPVIVDPLYYTGLGLLAGSIGCAALRLLSSVRAASLRIDGFAATVAAAAVVYLLALVCFGLALRALDGVPLSHDFNEALMWGGGHVLQFVNTLLLVAAWGLLAAPFVTRLPPGALALSSGPLLLGALPAPAFYFVFAPFSPEQSEAFTWLQYVLGPAAAIMALAVIGRIRRPWPWREPAFLALALSMLLFAVGGTLGLFVNGADTRTPAHYHGVIAGVNLAFFGLFFSRFLPLLGRQFVGQRRARLILHLFAWGQLAACVGLFIAGGHGAPRKVAGDAQGLTDLVPMIGMGLNGLGGLVAVIGGILFVWTVASALLHSADANKSLARRTVR
jgi:cytochrome c oxidase subunit I